MILAKPDPFAGFDEVEPEVKPEPNGRPSIRYAASRPVGGIIHRGCGGLVFQIGKTDMGAENGITYGWVVDWQCQRCGQALQGADCKVAYTDKEGAMEINIARDLARGRR